MQQKQEPQVGRANCSVSHPVKVHAIGWVVLAASLVFGCDAAPKAAMGQNPADGWNTAPAPGQMPLQPTALTPAAKQAEAAHAALPATPARPVDRAQEARACQTRIDEARRAPALPGAPKLEAKRALIMARGAKAEPVVFVREPHYVGEKSRMTEVLRSRVSKNVFPRDAALSIGKQLRGSVPIARDVFLREGYFYADDPGAAEVIPKLLPLDKLFIEPKLWIERGSQRFSVVRNAKQEYEYADGPEKGLPAELLLFDRVGLEGEDFGPPLHLDVRELAHRQGFDRMRIVHLGETHVVAELRYDDEWVSALLKREGASLSVECQAPAPERIDAVARAADSAYRRAAVLRSLRKAIVDQVRARLPFDEPKTEVGQQDGELRARFYDAYVAGKTKYEFNRDEYQVFDKKGQPLVPQVCVDFITETIERASGMRWATRGEKPERTLGSIDFDEILKGKKRRESALRDYAREHPEQFSLLSIREADQVKYKKVWPFFHFIERRMDDFQPGDIVIIKGYAPWDYYQEQHTHTFFVYEADPVTGMPMLLAGNSGRPRIIGWDSEMLRAPLRSIRYRIRPNTDWLYDELVLQEPSAEARWAPPLGVRFPG